MNALGKPGSGQDAAVGSGSEQQQPGPPGANMANGNNNQQQQLNMAMQNPVQMMQVIQAQITNLQRQWATVQAQPESTQKMEAAQHLAVQMKRMKFLQTQTAQALQNRQQQSSPQQAALIPQQGGPQSQPIQQTPSTQIQSTEGQGSAPISQPPNGTTIEASNPAHNAQLAALQAFAQQQRMQAIQQQQRGSFDGQAWQPGGQGQPPTTTNGSIAPQSNQPAQSPAIQPAQVTQAAQGTAKGDLVGAVRAFMAARGTPLPPNMATAFVGPASAIPTETKTIEMQTLFATVVQFGGSARVSAQQNGWAIVASKLGLGVAPIPQNHIAGQNEVDGKGLPLPAFVAPRLCQFFKDRFSAFEEFWLAKMKGAGGQAAAAAYVATNGNTGQQQQQQPQHNDGQQTHSLEMQGQGQNMQQMGMQNGSMQQSAQAGPSNLAPQMMQQPASQQMPGQPLLSGAASVQEAAQKAQQLQTQLPRQMQQLQELINAGKMTQQQARDRYMYLQNAAKMAMLQAQALAQAHAASQAAASQSQQSQGMMTGQQPSFTNQQSNSMMPSTDVGQMGPPLQQQQQQQQPTPTMEPKKGPKRSKKGTAGTAKAGSSAPVSENAQTAIQATPSQLNLQAQQAMRMLQQGNLNPTLQIGAFATIRTAQLASQGITGVDVTSVSQAMAQIYSHFLTQAQNAGQPMHVAAPLAFTAAQQDAHKQQLQSQASQNQSHQQAMQPPSLQQQQQQQASQDQQHQQPARLPSPYPPRPSSQQAISRPSSQAEQASQLQIPLQAPTKPGKFKVEYLPIRRDVHSHGGWDLDVVERQMGDYLEGKGRFPRSVRELGHVDVESLIMSLRSRLEVEITYSLNALFVLTAGVQAPGFHLLLSLCEDLCDELLDILEEAAFGKLYQEEDGYSDEEEPKQLMSNGVSGHESPLSYAEWVTGIIEEEDTLRICEQRGRKKIKRTASEDAIKSRGDDMRMEGVDSDEEKGLYLVARDDRNTLRCSQVAISILEIFRNLATIEDNHLFLNSEPRFMRLLMEIILSTEFEQRQRLKGREKSQESNGVNGITGNKGRATVFSSLEGLRLRKDVLCIIACLSGETCNLTRLDQETATAMFDLVASFIKDASDIEQEHGTVYGEVPINMSDIHRTTGAAKMQPMLRKVPQHADMALEAFSSLAQPDVNRQLLGKIIDEVKLISLGADLIKLLPVSDVDFQMLKTEARLGYCERIAMSLFNIAYLGSPRVKRQLKEAVGAVGIIFRCIKRLIRVNTFSRNPFAVITRRLIETLRMLDGDDNFNRPALLGFGMQDSQGSDNRGRERSGRGGLLVQDELSVVELMTVEGIDPVMVGELEQLL